MNDINKIVETLQSGGVVLIATDTVYGLAAMPSIPEAVERVYALKERPRQMHLPIMVADLIDLEAMGLDVNQAATRLMYSSLVPGAVTLVLGFREDAKRPDWLQGREEVAVRIPDNERLLAVLRLTGPLLVTSANKHGSPSTPSRVEDILAELNGSPNLVVEDGIGKEIPSTIVNFRGEPAKIERLGLITIDEINKVLGHA